MTDDYNLSRKQLSSAFASIAEEFMNEPLWYIQYIYYICNSDDPDAEKECERSLKEALKIDNENIDALQVMANLRLIRARDGEAIELIQKVVTLMLDSESKLNFD